MLLSLYALSAQTRSVSHLTSLPPCSRYKVSSTTQMKSPLIKTATSSVRAQGGGRRSRPAKRWLKECFNIMMIKILRHTLSVSICWFFISALQQPSDSACMCVLFRLIWAVQEDEPSLCQYVSSGPLKRICKHFSLYVVNPSVRVISLKLGKRFFILC